MGKGEGRTEDEHRAVRAMRDRLLALSSCRAL